MSKDEVREQVEELLCFDGPQDPTHPDEIRAQIIEKHGEEYLDQRVLSKQLEEVFDALSTENDDLTEAIQDLQEQLDDALDRKRDVLVILGTLEWLDENIINQTVLRGAIRDVLDQDLPGYKSLLARYGALSASTHFDENGRFISWRKRRLLDPTKFSGVAVEKDVLRCPKCQLGFRDEEDLDRHIASECEYQDEEAFFQKREDVEKMRKSRFDLSKELYCDVCDYTAKSPGGLASHKRGKAHKRQVALSKPPPTKRRHKAKKKARKGKKNA